MSKFCVACKYHEPIFIAPNDVKHWCNRPIVVTMKVDQVTGTTIMGPRTCNRSCNDERNGNALTCCGPGGTFFEEKN